MGKFGIKIFFTKRNIAITPSLHLYIAKGYKQINGDYYPDEFVFAFCFLTINIELWNNKFWNGFFKINKLK
jgi:hypothetical protein